MSEIFYGVANPALLARLAAVSRFHSDPLPSPVEVSPATRRAVLQRLERNPAALRALERKGVRARIGREVLQERRQREFERQAAIFAAARGEELSPVPKSGAALQMAKLLAGQALLDPDAAKILENLGLNPTGRNVSWKGPLYSDSADAELDRPVTKALEPGARERTASPRHRS